MTKLTFDHVYESFGIGHFHSQQVSYATLLDDSGNVVTPEIVLERDGHDHVSDIFAAVEDWHLEQAALVAEEQEHAA